MIFEDNLYIGFIIYFPMKVKITERIIKLEIIKKTWKRRFWQ